MRALLASAWLLLPAILRAQLVTEMDGYETHRLTALRHLLHANAAEAAEDWEHCLEEAGAACAADPSCDPARLARARAWTALGRLREAEEDLRGLIEARLRQPPTEAPPSTRRAVVQLGEVLDLQKRPRDALVAWSLLGRLDDRPLSGFQSEGDHWARFGALQTELGLPGQGVFARRLGPLADRILSEKTNWRGLHNPRAASPTEASLRTRDPSLALFEDEWGPPPPRPPASVSLVGRVRELPPCGATLSTNLVSLQACADMLGDALWILPPEGTSVWRVPSSGEAAREIRLKTPADAPVVSMCAHPEGLLAQLRNHSLVHLLDREGQSRGRQSSHSLNRDDRLLALCPRTLQAFYKTDQSIVRRFSAFPGDRSLRMEMSDNLLGDRIVLDSARLRVFLLSDAATAPECRPHVPMFATATSVWRGTPKDASASHVFVVSYNKWGDFMPLSVRHAAARDAGATVSVSGHGDEIVVAGGGLPREDEDPLPVAQTFSTYHLTETPVSYPVPAGATVLAAHLHPFADAVAVVDSAGLAFHPRGGGEGTVRVDGRFTRTSLWSLDGTLFLTFRLPSETDPRYRAATFRFEPTPAEADQGRAFAQRRQAWAEEGKAWAAAFAARAPAVHPTPPGLDLSGFDPASTPTLEAARAELAGALAEPTDWRTGDWKYSVIYNQVKGYEEFLAIHDSLTPSEAPFALRRFRKGLDPAAPLTAPQHYLQGRIHQLLRQPAPALSNLCAAARLDLGRTTLADDALARVIEIALDQGNDPAALHAWAARLRLLEPTEARLQTLQPLLDRHGIPVPRELTEYLRRVTPPKPPVLAWPAALAQAETNHFARGLSGVALVRVADTTHLAMIADEQGHLLLGDLRERTTPKTRIEVRFPSLGARQPVAATLRWRDSFSPWAVVHVAELPPGAKPLPLAAAIPAVGDTVHAFSLDSQEPWAPVLRKGLITRPGGRVRVHHNLELRHPALLLDAFGNLTGFETPSTPCVPAAPWRDGLPGERP